MKVLNTRETWIDNILKHAKECGMPDPRHVFKPDRIDWRQGDRGISFTDFTIRTYVSFLERDSPHRYSFRTIMTPDPSCGGLPGLMRAAKKWLKTGEMP